MYVLLKLLMYQCGISRICRYVCTRATSKKTKNRKGIIELLPRARDGRLTQEDWELLLKRQPNSLTADEKAEFKDATRLFFSKREVNRFNGKKLRELEKPIARASAVHTGANARRASADTAEGLERDLYLAKGAKVMLTKNLYQQVGLVNGIRGEVVQLVYACLLYTSPSPRDS